jgi:predicted dehydrogenase
MPAQPRKTRRDFLSTTLRSGIAAMAAPYIVPSSVFGANDRVGVGYIGFGRRAKQLLGLPKGMQIVAINDLYAKRVKEGTDRFKCTGYSDYRELLADPNVDAIITATPDHWHTFITVESCKAGKDVYVEKPLTLTVKEGRQMTEAARKYKRIVQCGSQQRSMKECRVGCELVRNGHVGAIHTIHGANYPSPWECDLPEEAVPEGLQWNLWCGQTTPRPYHTDLFLPRAQGRADAQGRRLGWISFRPYSGGEITGWGAHGIDIIQWAMGMEDTGPVEMWPEGEGLQCPLTFRYANGALLKLDGKGPGGGAWFVGDEGKILVDRGKYEVQPKSNAKNLPGNPAIQLPVSDHHLKNWEDSIRSRELPIADVEAAHRSTTVCHLGNIARWLGRRLQWDPAAERFINDDEANSLLERSQRAPYQIEV